MLFTVLTVLWKSTCHSVSEIRCESPIQRFGGTDDPSFGTLIPGGSLGFMGGSGGNLTDERPWPGSRFHDTVQAPGGTVKGTANTLGSVVPAGIETTTVKVIWEVAES